MSKQESQHPPQSKISVQGRRFRFKRSANITNIMYWQVLVGLFGFVVSLGLQILFGLYLLIDVLCGAEITQVDVASCSEMTVRSTFLVSLAATSSLFTSLGVMLVARSRKMKGSFLFSWVVSYLFFAFFAMLREEYFLDLWGGSGQTDAYWLAAVAAGGGLIAAIAYHLPRWLLSDLQQPAKDLNEQQ